MLYIDSNLINTLKFLPVDSIGRIIKKLILENDFQDFLNDIETSIYNELKAKNDKRKDNIKQINIKGWQKRKEQKKQKEDLPIQQTNFKKSIYNNYKQLPSQNTQQTPKEYQKKGTLTI